MSVKWNLYAELNADNEALRERLSVYSAFELYLDFINIFMYILQMIGNRD